MDNKNSTHATINNKSKAQSYYKWIKDKFKDKQMFESRKIKLQSHYN